MKVKLFAVHRVCVRFFSLLLLHHSLDEVFLLRFIFSARRIAASPLNLLLNWLRSLERWSICVTFVSKFMKFLQIDKWRRAKDELILFALGSRQMFVLCVEMCNVWIETKISAWNKKILASLGASVVNLDANWISCTNWWHHHFGLYETVKQIACDIYWQVECTVFRPPPKTVPPWQSWRSRFTLELNPHTLNHSIHQTQSEWEREKEKANKIWTPCGLTQFVH